MVVILIKRCCPNRKKLPELSEEMVIVDFKTPMLSKDGLPESESTEFKVPIEDDKEPVNT